MEVPRGTYNPFEDPNELYSAARQIPPSGGVSGGAARPEPEYNTGYLRPSSITQPNLESALDLRERHVGGASAGAGAPGGGTAGGGLGANGTGDGRAGGLRVGAGYVSGPNVSEAARVYGYDQTGDLGTGGPGFDRANDFAREPHYIAGGAIGEQRERPKLKFQTAYMWRLFGLLKVAQIILNFAFAVSSSIYLPCFYGTGAFIEATGWITFALICFSFLLDAFGVVPLLWARWRLIEFVGALVLGLWVLTASIAAMVYVIGVVPGAGFLIASTLFGYFVAFLYVALGVLAILDHNHRLPRWA